MIKPELVIGKHRVANEMTYAAGISGVPNLFIMCHGVALSYEIEVTKY